MTTEHAQSGEPVKAKRPRIQPKPSNPAIEDSLDLIENKSKRKSRHIKILIEEVSTVFCLAEHYLERHLFGDVNGPRKGIDPTQVERLVNESVKHLIFYACHAKLFSFLNMDPLNGQAQRLVLRKEIGEETLNVVIEVHFLNLTKYELTVITAMCHPKFEVFDGQYAIQIEEDDTSTLYQNKRGSIQKICSI